MKDECHFPIAKESEKKIAETLAVFFAEFDEQKRKDKKLEEPIIVCIGSDLAIGDAVGPLCGTMLQNKKCKAQVYGHFGKLVTAKNVVQFNKWLKEKYPNSLIIAIDAAVTEDEKEVGMIKLIKDSLRPGIGAKKKLGKIGDFTIMGITCEKPFFSQNPRLGMVYAMAKVIANGVNLFLKEWEKIDVSVKETGNGAL